MKNILLVFVLLYGVQSFAMNAQGNYRSRVALTELICFAKCIVSTCIVLKDCADASRIQSCREDQVILNNPIVACCCLPFSCFEDEEQSVARCHTICCIKNDDNQRRFTQD